MKLLFEDLVLELTFLQPQLDFFQQARLPILFSHFGQSCLESDHLLFQAANDLLDGRRIFADVVECGFPKHRLIEAYIH